MRFHQACDALGLPLDADRDMAKQAYRRLANIHHPDKGGDAEKFKEIAAAYRAFVTQAPLFRTSAHADDSPFPPPMPPEPEITPEDLDDYRHFVRRAEAMERRAYVDNRWAFLILLFLALLLFVLYVIVTDGREEFLLLLLPIAAGLFLMNHNQLLYWANITFNLFLEICASLRVWLSLLIFFALFYFAGF